MENWHYLEQGTVVGPVGQASMEAAVRAGTVRPDTQVWPGAGNWVPAAASSLSPMFSGAATPAPAAWQAVTGGPDSVALRNPATGETAMVKIGWSWVLFLFSAWVGIPLFLRKLNVIGAIFVVPWVGLIAGALLHSEPFAIVGVFGCYLFLPLSIWLGIKGNEITAKNYLQHGWQFVNPQDAAAQRAKVAWGIF